MITRSRCYAVPRLIAVLSAAAISHPALAQDADGDDDANEEIVVQATRSGKGAGDEAIRVEVVDREEIEEKLMMSPGNVAMLVAETPGVRVQVTSPSLGSSNVRMQGMEGRFTQLLADGLPLYGQASSTGLLQIPPSDLGQVEVIKGAASALYGASALGGVINFVSRHPGAEPVLETQFNINNRHGQDVVAYGSAPLGGGFGLSLTGGFDRQSQNDLDGDGWADIPSYRRWTARPRLFWDGPDGKKVLLTLGAMTEDRFGGTLPGRTAPDGQPFVEAQKTDRFDAGLTADIPVSDSATLHFRGSGMTQKQRHQFGDVVENDHHDTEFGEASVSIDAGATNWLAGAAIQSDGYRSKTFPVFNYVYTVPGLFAQVETKVSDDLTLSGSARWDDHNRYGSHLSPRISAMYKPGPWTIRASYGRGFYAPTPFVEEIEAAGLSRLEPLSGLKVETAETASLDLGYRAGGFSANVTLFGSNVDNAVQVQTVAADRVRLINANGVTRTRGAEVLLKYRLSEFTFVGSYNFVSASEPDPEGMGRRTVPRTPRHSAGFDAMWEKLGRGRIGLEAYYTGKQQLDENPYRTVSKPYVEIGALGELVLGKVRLFVNAENILNVRQTKYDPLLLPARGPDGGWTVDAWAPTDGFVLSGGIRFVLGGK